MKKHPRFYPNMSAAFLAPETLWIQAPLPHSLHTLPKLITIEGRGRCLAGPPPSASAEEPANAK